MNHPIMDAHTEEVNKIGETKTTLPNEEIQRNVFYSLSKESFS